MLKKGVVIPFNNKKKDSENLNAGDLIIEEIKQLNEILSMNDELFINMSHELKTPLNVIFSAAQLMEMSLTTDDNNENVIKGLDSIRKNCYRLTKVINNIIEINKINNGDYKLQISKEDIVEVTREIVQATKEFIEDSGLKIYFNSNVNKTIIPIDKLRIEKVLLNLISNSIKFSKPGGHIIVNIDSKGDYVEISVKDDGIGIDEKNLHNIFKRFGQVDKSLSRIAEGMGLGLILVKSIIEMHGGSVSVQSTYGKGSEFKLRIPIKSYNEYGDDNKILMEESKEELIKIELSDIYKAE